MGCRAAGPAPARGRDGGRVLQPVLERMPDLVFELDVHVVHHLPRHGVERGPQRDVDIGQRAGDARLRIGGRRAPFPSLMSSRTASVPTSVPSGARWIAALSIMNTARPGAAAGGEPVLRHLAQRRGRRLGREIGHLVGAGRRRAVLDRDRGDVEPQLGQVVVMEWRHGLLGHGGGGGSPPQPGSASGSKRSTRPRRRIPTLGAVDGTGPCAKHAPRSMFGHDPLHFTLELPARFGKLVAAILVHFRNTQVELLERLDEHLHREQAREPFVVGGNDEPRRVRRRGRRDRFLVGRLVGAPIGRAPSDRCSRISTACCGSSRRESSRSFCSSAETCRNTLTIAMPWRAR